MHVHSRLPAALLLSLLATTGCRDTLPSLFLHVEDPQALGPTQLRVTVEADGLAPATLTRPEPAAASLTGSQTLRLLLPDAAVGLTVRVSVEALKAGTATGRAEGSVEIVSGKETPLSVILAPLDGTCPSGDCACSATTCPNGCCQEGRCVTASTGACGTAGGACSSCALESSDRCIEGACRCGTELPCAGDHRCEDGACVPTSVPACETASDCVSPPGQCHEAQGTCSDGTCHYAPKALGLGCSDGDSCTVSDRCDGEGRCLGTAMACNSPPGQCHEASGACIGGDCQYAAKQAGSGCEDGNACTTGDTCNGAGTCSSGATKACNSPPGQCHQSTGTCNSSTGECTYPLKPTDTACNADDNACTTDVCDSAGACVVIATKVCDSPPGSCFEAGGLCLPSTGSCSYQPKSAGAPCGSTSCTSSTCNGSGTCVTSNLPNGTACGIGCVTCFNGTCSGFCGGGQHCCPGGCRPIDQYCE